MKELDEILSLGLKKISNVKSIEELQDVKKELLG